MVINQPPCFRFPLLTAVHSEAIPLSEAKQLQLTSITACRNAYERHWCFTHYPVMPCCLITPLSVMHWMVTGWPAVRPKTPRNGRARPSKVGCIIAARSGPRAEGVSSHAASSAYYLECTCIGRMLGAGCWMLDQHRSPC